MHTVQNTTSNANLPKAVPKIVPRFDLDDVAALQYLDDNGIVVFKNIASPQEVQKGLDLAWDYIEKAIPGVKRNDVNSYNSPNWPKSASGIISGDGAGHSDLLWFVRGLDKVKQVFTKVWNTTDLITSFDGFGFHRPWEYNPEWKTKDGYWYHLDQNGITKPGKTCVQGLMNFLPAGETDGGLIVVPKSHKIFNKIFETRSHLKDRGDFVPLADDLQFWDKEFKEAGLECIKICCQPGDFVLWDSRIIHCNCSASTARPIPTDGTILPPRRLVTYVCMTPASRITEELKAARVKFFNDGQTTSHWPEDCVYEERRKNTRPDYVPPTLTPAQKKLIPLT